MTKLQAAAGGDATPLPAAQADDRLLLELGRELDRLWETVHHADLADDDYAEDSALARIKSVSAAIAAIQAQTASGAAVQLAVLHGLINEASPYDPRILLLHSVLGVIERLGQLGADHMGRRRYFGPDPFRAAAALAGEASQ